MFSGAGVAVDLFPEEEASSSTTMASNGAPKSPGNMVTQRKTSNGFWVRALKPPARRERFEGRFNWVREHLGRHPKAKDTQVRKGVWNDLIQYATDKKDLQKVVSCMSEWKDMGRTFDESVTRMFISTFAPSSAILVSLTRLVLPSRPLHRAPMRTPRSRSPRRPPEVLP